MKRKTDSKHDGPIAPNVLSRNFTLAGPNRAWITDVTATATATEEGWLYLAVMLDLHHSDRGSPYASADYRAKPRAHRVRRSMGRKGDCWDNAVAESFFATLRAALVDQASYASRFDAHMSVGDYINNFYNVARRRSHLGQLNPVDLELIQRHHHVA